MFLAESISPSPASFFFPAQGDTIGIAATRGGHRETLEVCLETGVSFAAKNKKGRYITLVVAVAVDIVAFTLEKLFWPLSR